MPQTITAAAVRSRQLRRVSRGGAQSPKVRKNPLVDTIRANWAPFLCSTDVTLRDKAVSCHYGPQ